MQQPQKRIILMPEICHQYLSVSKGVYLLQDKSHRQKQHRDAKRQQQNQSSAAFLSGFSGGGCLDSVAFMKMSPYQMILTATAAANSSTVTVIAI